MKFYLIQFCLGEKMAQMLDREPEWYTVAVFIDEQKAEENLPCHKQRHPLCPVRILVADALPLSWMPYRHKRGWSFYYIAEDAWGKMSLEQQFEWLVKRQKAVEELLENKPF